MSLFKSLQKKFFPKKKKNHTSTRHSGTLRQSPTATDWYSESVAEITRQRSLQVALAQQQMMQTQAQQANLARQLIQSQSLSNNGYTFYGGASVAANPVPDFSKKTVKKPDEKNKKILEQILKHTLDESK